MRGEPSLITLITGILGYVSRKSKRKSLSRTFKALIVGKKIVSLPIFAQ